MAVPLLVKTFRLCLVLQAILWLPPALHAAGLQTRTWQVDGVTREALVSVPSGATPAAGWPVVFAFHGHGGSMNQASRSFPIHQIWPGAIVVYPQGLPTPGRLTDPQGLRAGWQSMAGAQGDRDLRYFDTMLASLRKEFHVDDRRIYATGHSNGGLFTYLLWAERGEALAAVAPSAALLARGYEKLKPKPVLHLGSPEDPLVKFSWQSRMIDYVLRVDGCGPRAPDAHGYVSYPSSNGNEVAVYLHGNGHRFPPDGAERIVKFFQSHPRS